MTRKEALSKYPNGWMEEGSYNDYPKDEIVNKIYDDFESRVCKNCKYFMPDGLIMSCEKIDLWESDDFGCNKFENKEEVNENR